MIKVAISLTNIFLKNTVFIFYIFKMHKYIIHLIRSNRPYILQKFTVILYVMKNKNFYTKLGINIKKQRKLKKLTQQNLADMVGITLNHMGKIEVAYSKPSLDLMVDIANALDITVSDLCK